MSFLPLDATTVPLAETQAIEASAGTGKTWSIAALYLRLVVEAALPVEKILVVTYTTSATAELRERIRARLNQARLVFLALEEGAQPAPGHPPTRPDEAPSVDDPVLQALITRVEARRASALLTLAIESLDLAAIHTIHGFCQRALEERAFESGEDFQTELLSDEASLLSSVARDFWRLQVQADPDTDWVRWLTARLGGPEGLLDALRGQFGRPYLIRLRPALKTGEAAAALQTGLAAFCRAWAQEGASMVAALLDCEGLSGVSHKPAQIQTSAEQIHHWVSQGALPEAAPLEALRKFSPASLQKATTKGLAARGGVAPRALHEICGQMAEACALRDEDFENRLGHFLADGLEACEQALAERKRQLGRLGFDDLLTRLAEALQGPGGEPLALRLRDRYRAALIDEFQDTDPIQYEIFRRVFHRGGLPLFFVGDPKQAIYRFRGADLQAYLGARDEAAAHWALGTNRRSVPGLVSAVNALFQRQTDAFRCPGLRFAPVQPSPTPPAPLLAAGKPLAPMSFWFLSRANFLEAPAEGEAASARSAGEKSIDKATAHPAIARAVAEDIASLLARSAAGEVCLGERPLNGGDMAVLVKSHRQARLMRDALAAAGVPCVRYGQDSVFDSREALEVERVLLAVAEPGRSGLVKAALATDLLGRRGEDLYHLDQDEPAWEAVARRFHDWHQRCRARGFAFLWQALLAEEKIPQRLLGLADGERRLTNLQHLGDLLQQLAHDEGFGPDALAQHLADHRRGEADGELITGDARLLRLESDEKLVRIVTIHASKGLEYPVVYCPWLWEGPSQRQKLGPVLFHSPRPATGEPPAGEDLSRGALDFGSPDLALHREWADEAAAEEQLRLAYVALTRAKHRCVVVWGALKGADASPLGWLLHGDLSMKKTSDRQLREALENLASESPGLEIRDLLPDADATPAQPLALPESPLGTLRARAFTVALPARWRTHSFTTWASAQETSAQETSTHPEPQAGNETPLAEGEGAAASMPPTLPTLSSGLAPLGDEVSSESPDHDLRANHLPYPPPQLPGEDFSLSDPQEDMDGEEAPAAQALSDAGTHFPRGAGAGVCLHNLLETLDFAAYDGPALLAAISPAGAGVGEGVKVPVLIDPTLERQQQAIRQALLAAGLPVEHGAHAARLLHDCVHAPLSPQMPSLAGLPASGQKRELEFLFPLAAPDSAALAAAIGPGQGADGRLDQRVAQLAPVRAAGFLKGFVDLVFEYDGRLHLLDYKSNWLGPHVAHYAPAALAEAMAGEMYDFQALLYAVALHRLQRWRRPDYDPARHLGDAWYLFLRGMDAHRPGQGVFHWRPAPELVLRVDACLQREEKWLG